MDLRACAHFVPTGPQRFGWIPASIGDPADSVLVSDTYTGLAPPDDATRQVASQTDGIRCSATDPVASSWDGTRHDATHPERLIVPILCPKGDA